MKKILILLFCVFLLTGCYDCLELNNINIVTGIGFDYKDDEYEIVLEITKSFNESNSTTIKGDIISVKDSNLAMAMMKAINSSDKTLVFKHVNVVAISESLAKKGIDDVIDYLVRDVNLSSTFFTVICESPNDLFLLKIDNDTVTNTIVSSITTHINAELLNNIDIIVSNIINERRDIALPYVEIIDDKIVIQDKAYFKKDKMIGKVNNKIYNFLFLGNENLAFKKDNNVFNIYDKNISYKIYEDKIIILVKGKGRLIESNSDIDLKDKDSYIELEKILNEEVKVETEDFLHETLDNDSDLVGLKDLYYKRFKKEKDNINYEILTDIKLVKNGAIYEVIHD